MNFIGKKNENVDCALADSGIDTQQVLYLIFVLLNRLCNWFTFKPYITHVCFVYGSTCTKLRSKNAWAAEIAAFPGK